MGQESWDRYAYSCSTKIFSNVVQAVCSNGVLYSLDSHGRIGTFDGKYESWSIIPSEVFERVCIPYLVEFNGEIFAGKQGPHGVIEKLYKLKIDDGVAAWKEEKDLGNATFFLGPYGSCAMLGLNEGTEKELFTANYGPEPKYVVIYNVNGHDYKEVVSFGDESFSWWYTPIWIERSIN